MTARGVPHVFSATSMYELLCKFLHRPEVFSTSTTKRLWTAPHLAGEMLRLHLDGDSELASRGATSIDAFVSWLDARIPLRGRAVLDLGCGPGLYAERFARRGASVTGLDFSTNSIAYAQQSAMAAGLTIDYRCADYLEAELPVSQDVVTLIYGDFCVLAPARRRRLLDSIRGALAGDGRFVFDVFSSDMLRGLSEEVVVEKRLMHGFWAAGDYVGFKARFVYPDVAVVLERYLIVAPDRTFEVDNWLQYYTPTSISTELAAAGFSDIDIVDIVTGGCWEGGPTAFAVIAHA